MEPTQGSSTVLPAVGEMVPKTQRGVSTVRDNHEDRGVSYSGKLVAPGAARSAFHPTLPCESVCLHLS